MRYPLPTTTLPRTTVLFTLAMLLAVLQGCNDIQAAGAPPVAPPVDVTPVLQQKRAEVEEFTGRLDALDLVEIRPRIAGAIQKVHVQDGAQVAAGALLFTIDPRPYEAEVLRSEAALLTARAQSRLAERELARALPLLSEQAVAQQEVDQLGTSAEISAAAVRQAEAALKSARLNLDYTAVRAPVAGRVSRIDATLGNLVNDQRVLTTLVANGKMQLFFDVSEASFLRLRKAPDVQRQIAVGLADEPTLPRTATVDFIDNRMNPQTATIRLRARMENSDGHLLPGLFARLRVNTSAPRDMVLAPDRAVMTDQDRKFVWVIGEGNQPQMRPVQLGGQVDALRIVNAGLKPGELIVVGGLQRVRPGQPVTPQRVDLDERGIPKPAAQSASASTGGKA